MNLQKSIILVALSLSLSLLSCQTTEVKTKDTQELLNSQIQLVKNHLDGGDPRQALMELRDLLRIYPKNPTLHTLMGFTQLALKNSPKSLQHLKKAFQLEPSIANGLNLTAAYIENGKFKAATKILGRLAKKKDQYQYPERIFHNLGYVAERLGDTKKAEIFYTSATKENPTFYPSLLQLAKIQDRDGRSAEALQTFRQAMDYCHVCLEPVEAVAQNYMKLGQYAHAREALMRYSRIRGVAAPDLQRANELVQLSIKLGERARRTAGSR